MSKFLSSARPLLDQSARQTRIRVQLHDQHPGLSSLRSGSEAFLHANRKPPRSKRDLLAQATISDLPHARIEVADALTKSLGIWRQTNAGTCTPFAHKPVAAVKAGFCKIPLSVHRRCFSVVTGTVAQRQIAGRLSETFCAIEKFELARLETHSSTKILDDRCGRLLRHSWKNRNRQRGGCRYNENRCCLKHFCHLMSVPKRQGHRARRNANNSWPGQKRIKL